MPKGHAVDRAANQPTTDSLVFDRFTVRATPPKRRLWKIFLGLTETTQGLDLRQMRAVDGANFFAARKRHPVFSMRVKKPIPYGFSRCLQFCSRAVDDLRICIARDVRHVGCMRMESSDGCVRVHSVLIGVGVFSVALV